MTQLNILSQEPEQQDKPQQTRNEKVLIYLDKDKKKKKIKKQNKMNIIQEGEMFKPFLSKQGARKDVHRHCSSQHCTRKPG